MHALVVDDSRTTRLILRGLLRQLDFEVAEASSGLEGLDQLARCPQTALVLVDWNMPDMNGFDFIRAVRGDTRYLDVRLVVVSAEEGAADLAAARADAFVSKPFTREALQDKLQLLGIGQA